MSMQGLLRLFLVCLLVLKAAAPALAQDQPALGSGDFEFFAPITTPGGEEIHRDALYMVPLSGTILRHCSSDLRDLRLLDGYGGTETETPFTILTHMPPPNHAPMNLAVVSTQEDQDLRTLVLAKPSDVISLGSQVTALQLRLPDQDFFALAHVWGSYDMIDWESLATGVVFNFPSSSNVSRDLLPLLGSDHSYYKLELAFQETVPAELASAAQRFPDLAPLAQDRILFAPAVDTVLALPMDATAAPLDHYSLDSFDMQTRDQETVILAEARLPALTLRLAATTPYFLRDLDVYAADTPDPDAFTLVAQGTLYRFPMQGGGQVMTTMDVNTGKHRYYRIHIHNHDAEPLEVTEVVFSWQQRMLFFTALSDRADYALWFQSLAPLDSLMPPAYDLSSRVSQENWRSSQFTELEAAEVQRNLKVQALEFQRDSSERGWLNWIVAFLCIAVIIWLFVLLKRTHGNREAS